MRKLELFSSRFLIIDNLKDCGLSAHLEWWVTPHAIFSLYFKMYF